MLQKQEISASLMSLKATKKNQMTSKGTNTKIVLLTTVDAVPPDPPSRPQPAPPPPPPPPEK